MHHGLSSCSQHNGRSGARSPHGRSKCPRQARSSQDRVERSGRAKPHLSKRETLTGRRRVGWDAEYALPRSAFRFKEPYFWKGTGNCQSAREGAHRRWVMSADQLLDNKEGVLQEKVAAAATAKAAHRSLRGEGKVGEGRGGRRLLPQQLKAKELKGL